MHKFVIAALTLVFVNICLANPPAHEITLLPHQQKVLSYLEQHPNQKGLILYHALGAGKTITALSYAKQQTLKIVVLVPEALKAHWFKEIKKVGLDSAKVELLSYNNQADLKKIKATDFSKSLVIVDEIQKFIEYVRVTPDTTYLDIYWQLNKVGKILLLTGTPIYNDAADIAFIGNLAAGSEKFPFHPDEFKSKYMMIDTSTSLFRGYLTESKLMTISLPIYFSLLGMSLVVVAGTPWVMPILAMAGNSGLNYINEIHPINKVCFRKFDAPLFSPFSHEYISYYEAKEEDKKEYPSSSIHEKKVHYTNAQTSFFLDFIDGVLSKENLSLLLKDYPSYQYSDAMYYLNSSKIQQDILARGDSGREIGNLSLPGEYGLEEATKFVEIEEIIRKNKGKTAIYSSYYQNGILLFAEFLRQKNYSFEVLRPDVGVEEITRILDNFNRGENKILLIHPEITEGISLIGVEQMHILEPVKNIALQKQIIGRSVRYQSHTLLPKDRRHVDIYLWESKVVYSELLWPTEAGLLRRDQWRKRFREVNPNLWTNGITQLDRQYFKKDETPDFRVNHLKDQIAGDMESFRQVATEHSLEKETAASNSFTVSSQLTSKFATPLIYFNVSKEQPYYLTTFNDSEEVFKMVRRTALDFDIEIPHSDTLSVGFGMRGSAGKIAKEYLGREISIGTFDLDLGFLTRTHYEIPTLRDLSVYWKNELDTGIFIYVPAIGLSLGVRESLGAQVFLTKHLGLSVEAGFEGKVMKDTIFSKIEDDDGSKLEDSSALFKQISTMKTLHPFIAVGVFSTYF